MKKIIALFIVYIGLISGVMAKDIRFVQVTDLKYSNINDNGTLAEFVKEINNQEGINFVVFAGNNIDAPSAKNLEGFINEAKKLKKPFYVLIGDKDVNKHKNLSKQQYASYLRKRLWNYRKTDLNYTFEREGIVFMVVDGSRDIIPSSVGYYKEDVLDWVKTRLDKQSKKNVIILQHYSLTSPDGREVTFRPEKYLEILSSHNNVKAVISGSKYQNSEQDINGINHISTAPFPTYRVVDIVDCDTEKPTIWAEIREFKK